MIILTFDLTLGTAKLASSTTIKVGAQVPVQVVFAQTPGTVNSIQLALGDDSDAPAVLAYVEAFTAVNDTTYTAILDCTDSRLAAYMNGKGPTAVDLELGVTLDGEYQVAPNVSVTVQPAIIAGAQTTLSTPTFYTAAQVNNLLAPLIPAANQADIDVSATANANLFAANNFSALAIKIVAGAGSGAYTAAYALPTTGMVTGAIAEVNIELPASANPTITLFNATTSGTLLATVTNPAPANPAYWYGRFRFDGTAWHCLFRGFNL